MTGARTIKCSNGRWSNAKPICKAPCDKLVAPAHGRRSGNDFRHGRSVSFYCSFGYARVGTSPVTCNDGNWNNPAPVCKGVCPRPRTPSSGRLLGNKARFIEGDEVRFSCDSNYDLFGNAKLRCVGRNWDSREPVCKGQCTFDGNPDNGFTTNGVFWNGQSLPHGTNVKYACDVKYTLVGSNVRHCDDGSWNTSLPSCKASCNPLPALADGTVHNNGINHGALVSFSCKKGFQLKGLQQIMCIDGNWTATSPSCKERCQDPGNPVNGQRFGVNFTHGGVVQFRCKDGPFDLIGASRITCDEGEWSHPRPSCEDCVLVGSMFWGMWANNTGALNYYRVYITKMDDTHVDFALKVNKDKTRSYKRTEPVLILDKIPFMEDITVDSPVIAEHRDDRPFWYRTGTVKKKGSVLVLVKFDDGKITKWVRLENLRLVKRPPFCEDNI